MFFPMAEEIDMYESNGMQKDEINSVAEFIIHYAFNIIPSIPLDEDGDDQNFINTNNSYNYTIVSFCDYYLLSPGYIISQKTAYYNYHLPLIVEELFSPPPEIV
jgi:hypothetical protein